MMLRRARRVYNVSLYRVFITVSTWSLRHWLPRPHFPPSPSISVLSFVLPFIKYKHKFIQRFTLPLTHYQGLTSLKIRPSLFLCLRSLLPCFLFAAEKRLSSSSLERANRKIPTLWIFSYDAKWRHISYIDYNLVDLKTTTTKETIFATYMQHAAYVLTHFCTPIHSLDATAVILSSGV